MKTTVYFVNRFFYPDHSATSQMLTDLAVALSERGLRVKVVTSRSCYDNPEMEYPARGRLGQVEIHRVWTTRFGRASLPKRAVDYLSFYLSASAYIVRSARPGDVVVAQTDPPLLSVALAPLVRLRRAILANWLQDVFPEVAATLGLPIPSYVATLLRSLRNWSLRWASINVAISEGMAQYLEREGLPQGSVRVVHNWASGIVPICRSENQLRQEWGLADRFVVGYSGNMGRAHDLVPILEAARQIDARLRDVTFLFVGGGKQRDLLERTAAEKHLTNVLFKPYQPRAALTYSLSAPDVHIVSLRPELEGLVVPSKFYGAAAAGRAIVLIGSPSGDLGRIVHAEKCGYVVESGNISQLVRTIESLAAHRSQTEEMGRRARLVFERRFTKTRAAGEWMQALSALSGPL